MNNSKPFIHLLVNASTITNAEIQRLLSFNGTYLDVSGTKVFRDSQLNELLYVVIVIMFYALALMILLATQIRKQRSSQEVEYYDEYLERNDRLIKKKKMLAAITTVPEETMEPLTRGGKLSKPVMT
ncbi:hypothetical protein DPMN_081964 [Dreissena polymorpha]|uniref:Uncharacterized protein n=1 Tax=Dreissena polymorpha TaxID=45954 RepID=A0A9D4B9L4_DREPO|nr:hypothetical protein DPMN_081871 [Dreissena polymorpha]KAH3694524.1 hypothetical protein DPMN_081964 [Dreissena polymorpha]